MDPCLHKICIAAKKSKLEKKNNKEKQKKSDPEKYFADITKFVENFEKLLKGWDPKKYMRKHTNLRETDYRNSFKKFLESKFTNLDFLKEEKVRYGKVDLSLKFKYLIGGEGKIPIEFKYGLRDHGELQRLEGQIQDYEKGNIEDLYIVLIEDKNRKVERRFVEELKSNYNTLKRFGMKLMRKKLHVYIKQDKKGKSSVEKII